nr:MAG TPA: hypothetical protein [Caudoviricetes sp.]
MSIKGTWDQLYVGKKESNIISLWGNKKRIDYDGLKRIDYMYAAYSELGYLDFVHNSNKIDRFEFNKKSNEKILRTIELIQENNDSINVVEKRAEDLKFYERWWFIILSMFFCCAPVGLFLIWYKRKSTLNNRIFFTIMALILWGTWYYVPYSNFKSSMNQVNEAMAEYKNVLETSYSNNVTLEHTESADQSNINYKNVYKSATYKIGQDMPAGEYVLFAEIADVNYFQISNDSSGEITSISANGTFKTNTIVTVSNGQYFNFIGCYAVPITEVTELDTSKEGMFKIGIHLEPGEYQLWKTDGSDVSYYAVMKDSTHKMDSIKVNGVIESREYVTVEKGDYLELQGCYIME